MGLRTELSSKVHNQSEQENKNKLTNSEARFTLAAGCAINQLHVPHEAPNTITYDNTNKIADNLVNQWKISWKSLENWKTDWNLNFTYTEKLRDWIFVKKWISSDVLIIWDDFLIW